MKKNSIYPKIVKQIEICGQSLIDNAETIAGGYYFQTDPLTITITITENRAPEILVSQNFLPEKLQELE